MIKTSFLSALCLALVCSSVARAATVSLTFDELPFQPVDGLNYLGVTFGFSIDGVPSTDASYNASGPGELTYVQDPSLEGDAAGVLTLDFDEPTPTLQFGVALTAFDTYTPGFSVELFDTDLVCIGVIDVETDSLISFTEGLFMFNSQDWNAPPVKRAVITFNNSDATRYALDNLIFETSAEGVKPMFSRSAPGGSPWSRTRTR